MKEGERLFKGYWWLPSSPEKKATGVLTVEADGKMTLELLSMLGDYECEMFYDHPEDVIHGKCYDWANNMIDISLFACRPNVY